MAATDNPFWSQRQRDELALEHARPADLAEAEEEEEEQSFDLFGDDPPIEDLGNEGRQSEGMLPHVQDDQVMVELNQNPRRETRSEPVDEPNEGVTTRERVSAGEGPLPPNSWMGGSHAGGQSSSSGSWSEVSRRVNAKSYGSGQQRATGGEPKDESLQRALEREVVQELQRQLFEVHQAHNEPKQKHEPSGGNQHDAPPQPPKNPSKEKMFATPMEPRTTPGEPWYHLGPRQPVTMKDLAMEDYHLGRQV